MKFYVYGSVCVCVGVCGDVMIVQCGSGFGSNFAVVAVREDNVWIISSAKHMNRDRRPDSVIGHGMSDRYRADDKTRDHANRVDLEFPLFAISRTNTDVLLNPGASHWENYS